MGGVKGTTIHKEPNRWGYVTGVIMEKAYQTMITIDPHIRSGKPIIGVIVRRGFLPSE